MGVRYVLVKKKKVDASKAMTVCKVRNDRGKKTWQKEKEGREEGRWGREKDRIWKK